MTNVLQAALDNNSDTGVIITVVYRLRCHLSIYIVVFTFLGNVANVLCYSSGHAV